jgi:anti-sigma-K factor RskA
MDINNYISSGIIEMYVTGLCSAEESTELELLRTQYPQLNNAIIQFEIEFEKNAFHIASLTSNELDSKIINALQQLQTPVVPLQAVQPKEKRLNWLRPLAAAAVLLFIISSIFNYTFYKKNKEQQIALNSRGLQPASLPEADYNILKDPTITPVAMYGVAPHNICRCTLFWDKKTGKVYMMIHHLVPSTNEKKYQLWAMVNNKPVNVGMVNDGIRDRFIELQNVPLDATAFSVTLENIAGSATPTEGNQWLYGKI